MAALTPGDQLTGSLIKVNATSGSDGISACVFFFNDTATTEIYTLSLHDALPISVRGVEARAMSIFYAGEPPRGGLELGYADRKSTRLNSSHSQISYAVFCLQK